MKIATAYIAVDGTPFKSEAECLDYEKENFDGFEGIVAFRENGEEVTLENGLRSFLCECDYILLPTVRSVEWALSALSRQAYCTGGIKTPGIYIWCGNCEWVHLQTEMEKVKERMVQLETIAKFFKQE